MKIEAFRLETASTESLTRLQRTMICLGVAVIPLLLISRWWKPDQDSVAYLSMARSLACGRGMLHLGLHQWHYAPLYSVLICPTFWMDDRPFLAISIINIVTAWTIAFGTYYWFKRYCETGGLLIAGLVSMNIGLWDVIREARAETLFTSLLIWSAFFLAKALHSTSARAFISWLIVGSVFTCAACCTRQVGILLCGGFFVAMLIRYRQLRLSFLRLICALIPGLLASIVVGVLIVHDHRAAVIDHATTVITYTEQFRQPGVTLFAQVSDGIRRQTADVGRLLIPGMWGSFAHFGQWLNFNTIFYCLFSIPILINWWKLTRQTFDPLLLTVPFYAILFTIWPFDQGTRFNVPMLPVLWASVWMLLNRWKSRRPQIMMILLLLHLIVSLGYLQHDEKIVARWNQRIDPMKNLLSTLNDNLPVAARNLSPNDFLLTRYILDEPVIPLSGSDQTIRAEVHWLIQPAAATIPAQFQTVKSVGSWQLLRRD